MNFRFSEIPYERASGLLDEAMRADGIVAPYEGRPSELGEGCVLLPMVVQVLGAHVDPGRVEFRVTVNDREGRGLRLLRFVVHDERFGQWRGPRAIAHAARAALRQVLEHEIDELILVGGERVFDPHRDEEVGRVAGPPRAFEEVTRELDLTASIGDSAIPATRDP